MISYCFQHISIKYNGILSTVKNIQKEVGPNQVLLIWSVDGVTWDGLPVYLPLCGFVENSRIVIPVINENDYTCLYDWAQGLNFSLVGKTQGVCFPTDFECRLRIIKIYYICFIIYIIFCHHIFISIWLKWDLPWIIQNSFLIFNRSVLLRIRIVFHIS